MERIFNELNAVRFFAIDKSQGVSIKTERLNRDGWSTHLESSDLIFS